MHDIPIKGIALDKFVLQVPKWQGELLFSKEIIVFLGGILLMIVGTLFCFWGYKYFRAVLFLGIGAVLCYGSYLLVEPMTANLVIRMFLTVSLTFLGMCFVYFLDIVFGYLLDRLRIRSALGKRVYLVAAPLGAAILGLTIYFYIYRDMVVAFGVALCCLVPGLIFQHRKRKKMIRFRCYNDLLRLRRPKFDEDGLEILSDGAVGAAMPSPVSSVLTTQEPEPVPVMAVEPEPEPEFEPEPVFMMNAGRRALFEIESEFASKPEYGIGILPELPEPELSEPEPPEPDVAEKVTPAEDIRIEKITPVYPGKITLTKKDRKSRRRREEGMARGAAIVAAGLGAFLAGRITKGGD